jgi:hypothetical protein
MVFLLPFDILFTSSVSCVFKVFNMSHKGKDSDLVPSDGIDFEPPSLQNNNSAEG